MRENKRYSMIYEAVRRIPKGRIATYGQIARVLRAPGRARLIGRALRELPEGTRVPWHRVVNAQGRISDRPEMRSVSEQRRRLQREGVRFRPGGRIPMKHYQWQVERDDDRRPSNQRA